MNGNPKAEGRRAKEEIPNAAATPSQGVETLPVRFLTRFELAEALKISVRTVDTMVAGGELPHLRLRGNFIRFYLPDVVRHLSATALISKRRWAGPARKRGSPKAEGRGTNPEERTGKAEGWSQQPEMLHKETKGTKKAENLKTER